MTALHLDPVFWALGLALLAFLVFLVWDTPARSARRQAGRLHRFSREIHPSFNRRERRALASKRWMR